MMPNSRIFRKEWLRVLPAMVAAAVFFTWPLVLHFFSAIPRGSEPGYVAYFQYFCSCGRRPVDCPGLLACAVLLPYRGVFAWCEPQPFTYGLMALIAFAGHAASYNSVVILYMALNGAAVYAVARLLTADRVAAAWSGIWMCSGAYALQQICAPAMLAVCFAFFFIYFLFRLSYGFKQVYFYGSVVCFILVWFTAKQTAFMLVLLSPLYIAPLAAGIRDRRRAAAWGALFIAVTAAFVLPYVYAQWSCVRPMGFSRTLAEVRGVARWGDSSHRRRPLVLFEVIRMAGIFLGYGDSDARRCSRRAYRRASGLRAQACREAQDRIGYYFYWCRGFFVFTWPGNRYLQIFIRIDTRDRLYTRARPRSCFRHFRRRCPGCSGIRVYSRCF
jgi:hypothetical protein